MSFGQVLAAAKGFAPGAGPIIAIGDQARAR